MTARSIRHLHPAISDDIGDLRTQRPLPNGRLDQIDPFLFLNHHGPQVYGPNNRGLPFGPHPHRGFETVTFIVEGSLAHRDSAGHESVIRDGGVQWMTAGRGVVHEELSPAEFLRDGGPLEILQLWVNLPSRLKMTDPRYIGLQKDAIPVVASDGVRVNLIAGTFDGQRGPVETLTDITLTTIELDAGIRASLPVPEGHNVFFYVVRGTLRASMTEVPAMQLVEFNNDGDTIDVEATQDSLILFGHARPFGERVVAHGPFVMNSHEEIYQAMLDYQMGRFA
jgi:quercetin 2,3-dioxygenase